MSFLSSWKALTSLTIRGKYLFLAVALEEYFPVLIGASGRFGPRHQNKMAMGWGETEAAQARQGKENEQT